MLLPIVFAVTFAGIMANSLVTPALPFIAEDLGLTDLQAAFVAASAALPGIVLAPVIGVLADRVGRKRVVVACLVVFGIAGTAAVFANTFEQLLVLRILQGVGSAGLINLSVVLIGDRYEGVERGRWIGVNSTVLTLGLAVNPLIGGVLAEWNWRWAFVPNAFALVVAAAAALVLPHDRPQRGVSLRDYLKGVLGYAKTGEALALFASGTVVFVLVFAVVLQLFPFLLADEYDLGPSGIAVFLTGAAFVTGMVSLMSGRLFARFRARDLVVAGFVLLGMGYVVLAVSSGLVAVAVGTVLYALGEGTSIPIMQTLAAGLGPPEYRGGLVALWVGAVRGGQSAGPIGAGALQQEYGVRVAIGVASVVAFGWVGVQLALGRRFAKVETAITEV